MLEPIPFAGMVEIDESFDRTASHMAGEYVSNTEPVAYAMFRDGEYYDAIHPDEYIKTAGEYDIPLYTYTHPKELTDEEITQCLNESMDIKGVWGQPMLELNPVEFARAILRKASEK
jgi:hypothetical protein